MFIVKYKEGQKKIVGPLVLNWSLSLGFSTRGERLLPLIAAMKFKADRGTDEGIGCGKNGPPL